MAYTSLTNLLSDAKKRGYAVGAFNIFNYTTMRAVVEQCERQHSPVIMQTSVKTAKALGVEQMMDFMLPTAKKATIPVAIHLDHCTDINFAKACVDAGWSSIMLDGSHLPLEENIAATQEIVAYVKGKNVSVEGELGAIAGVEDDIVVEEGKEALADRAHAIEFTQKTGVDAFAPAIGTAHGVYKGEPKLDFTLFQDIEKTVECPLVVHGGTGLADDVFQKLIGFGATKINVSTALKVAYLTACKKAAEYKDPLQFDAFVAEEVQKVVANFVRIFDSEGKA